MIRSVFSLDDSGKMVKHSGVRTMEDSRDVYKTSYAHIYGQGNRSAEIIVTTTLGWSISGGGLLTTLVNGIIDDLFWFHAYQSINGKHLSFQFPSPQMIQEVTFRARTDHPNALSGPWTWRGSLDGVSWVNISDPFTVSTDNVYVDTTLASNKSKYVHYCMFGGAGTTGNSFYYGDIEFKL